MNGEFEDYWESRSPDRHFYVARPCHPAKWVIKRKRTSCGAAAMPL